MVTAITARHCHTQPYSKLNSSCMTESTKGSVDSVDSEYREAKLEYGSAWHSLYCRPKSTLWHK